MIDVLACEFCKKAEAMKRNSRFYNGKWNIKVISDKHKKEDKTEQKCRDYWASKSSFNFENIQEALVHALVDELVELGFDKNLKASVESTASFLCIKKISVSTSINENHDTYVKYGMKKAGRNYLNIDCVALAILTVDSKVSKKLLENSFGYNMSTILGYALLLEAVFVGNDDKIRKKKMVRFMEQITFDQRGDANYTTVEQVENRERERYDKYHNLQKLRS